MPKNQIIVCSHFLHNSLHHLSINIFSIPTQPLSSTTNPHFHHAIKIRKLINNILAVGANFLSNLEVYFIGFMELGNCVGKVSEAALTTLF